MAHNGIRPGPHPSPLSASSYGQRPVLVLSGTLDVAALGELEERLVDPRLNDVREWVLDVNDVTHVDLACAYALLRAATRLPGNAVVTIRGARRSVRRTLHDAGVDVVAVLDE